jgi:acetyltransferase-like isoleucine patch superfamily enzyme
MKNPYGREYLEFQSFLKTGRVSMLFIFNSLMKFPVEIIYSIFRNISGPVGMKIRYFLFKLKFKKIGSDCLFDIGINITGPRNISIGNRTWIDSYVCISAYLGEVKIGDNCHIGPHVVMGSRKPILIGDRVGIGAGSKIYSNSEKIQANKFLAGPMIPEDLKGFYSETVTIEDDVLIGANSIILPGVTLGRGCVIGANSVISESVEPWSVVIERGKKVFQRPKVPDSVVDQLNQMSK